MDISVVHEELGVPAVRGLQRVHEADDLVRRDRGLTGSGDADGAAVRGEDAGGLVGTGADAERLLFGDAERTGELTDEVVLDVELGVLQQFHADTAEIGELERVDLLLAEGGIALGVNHNISNIHMQYDGEGLAPRWQIDTLLQALYFAIFYMKPGIKMYKRCANPNCKRDVFFLTDRTKTNKDYCCVQCRSAAGQRRRRLAEQAEKETQP